ncbi:hypothetical protein [Promineifilum sp.]|uniref:hypothetical protein n=1 Tax=Promineifilum sp. TaxID=2664178 RepID=UPI0035AEBB65
MFTGIPITFVILLGLVLAVVGAAVAILTPRKRAGLVIMLVGLLIAGALSVLIFMATRTM